MNDDEVKTFSFWTVGYQDLGLRYKVHDRKPYRGKHSIESGVQKYFLGGSWMGDIFIDASPLQAEPHALGHIGEHHLNLQAFADSESFQQVMGDFVRHASRQRKSEIKVCVFCPRGTKRAVTVARALHNVMEFAGHKCVGPIHLSYTNWGNHTAFCESCKYLDNAEQIQVLYEIVHKFRSL